MLGNIISKAIHYFSFNGTASKYEMRISAVLFLFVCASPKIIDCFSDLIGFSFFGLAFWSSRFGDTLRRQPEDYMRLIRPGTISLACAVGGGLICADGTGSCISILRPKQNVIRIQKQGNLTRQKDNFERRSSYYEKTLGC